MNYSIREMRKEEYSLLGDFLYEAIYIPDGTATPPKSVIACPELQVYIADFGNSKHDKALIAEVDGNIVGAIWARIMNDYGHIDDNTPSLAMSVFKAYRGMGIGTSLLTQMLSTEKAAGYAKLSLSVQKDNYSQYEYNRNSKSDENIRRFHGSIPSESPYSQRKCLWIFRSERSGKIHNDENVSRFDAADRRKLSY